MNITIQEPRTFLNSNWRGNYIAIVGLIVALALMGCSSPRTYTQQGNAGKLIQVTCDSEHDHTIMVGENRMLSIETLDGEQMRSIASRYLFNGPLAKGGRVTTAYVKPGRHEMGLCWEYEDTYTRSSVWFVAEAGKSYAVRWKQNGTPTMFHPLAATISFWVEEVETGKRVGGILEQ